MWLREYRGFMLSKSFEEVMEITRYISGSTALEDAEAKALYDACLTVPVNGLVVETGCQLGRSSTVIAQVAESIGFNHIHIDPYFEGGSEYLPQWVQTMRGIHQFTLLCMRTGQADWHLERLCRDGIDMAFIDGDHEYQGVMIDLNLVANRIKKGGILTAHDYGRDSLPGVYRAVNEHIGDRWETVGEFGTLGVWRRR